MIRPLELPQTNVIQEDDFIAVDGPGGFVGSELAA